MYHNDVVVGEWMALAGPGNIFDTGLEVTGGLARTLIIHMISFVGNR